MALKAIEENDMEYMPLLEGFEKRLEDIHQARDPLAKINAKKTGLST